MTARGEVLAEYLHGEIDADIDWEDLEYSRKMYWFRLAAIGLEKLGIDYQEEADV